MKRVDEILADGRDDIVSEIARYVADCRGPTAGRAGAGGATAGCAGAMVDAFLESVEARRVGPFVEWAKRTARIRSREGWEPGEVGAALDLLESLAAAKCAEQAGQDTGRKVVSPIIEAGRAAFALEVSGDRS